MKMQVAKSTYTTYLSRYITYISSCCSTTGCCTTGSVIVRAEKAKKRLERRAGRIVLDVGPRWIFFLIRFYVPMKCTYRTWPRADHALK